MGVGVFCLLFKTVLFTCSISDKYAEARVIIRTIPWNCACLP